MKAFLVHEPNNYEVMDVPMPVIREDEVLVKVGAAAICHSDLDIIEGRRTHCISFPRIPGHEFAGTVVETGKLVTGTKPGDQVACEGIIWCGACHSCRHGYTSYCKNFSELGTMANGGFAEYVAVPGKMIHKFSRISMEEASCTEPAGNAYHAVEEARIVEGDDVVIIGPGPIGLFALQMAKLKYPRNLIMVGTRDERLEVAGKMGATHLINIRKTDAQKEIMNITDGKGAEKVIQCATKTDAFELALNIITEHSTIIIEGLDDTKQKIPMDFNNFIYKFLTITGVGGVTAKHFENTLKLMELGHIDVKSMITHVMPLEKIIDGFELLKSRNNGVIKVIIKP